MAGAVRHATRRITELKKKSKKRYAYQFYITDGEPNHSGEGIDPVQDTAKAVQEARAKGIKAFGIIIADQYERSRLEAQYQQIFGGGWYVVVESAEKILNPLMRFMRRVAFINR
jgi:nitric oxide reductase activation protein